MEGHGGTIRGGRGKGVACGKGWGVVDLCACGMREVRMGQSAPVEGQREDALAHDGGEGGAKCRLGLLQEGLRRVWGGEGKLGKRGR
eukprot:scaffold14306_cov80-Isochrysis_galbana.AAC.3